MSFKREFPNVYGDDTELSFDNHGRYVCIDMSSDVVGLGVKLTIAQAREIAKALSESADDAESQS